MAIMMMIIRRAEIPMNTVVLFLALLGTGLSAAEEDTWMNPRIGFTGDLMADISDVTGEWQRVTSQGINIRSAELSLGASIDPYAELTANVNFNREGAALHELYARFPSLGGNFALDAGWKLAKFGRWNQFHTHAMPFTAEPRIYREYFGGHFQGAGAELSWLAPTLFYLEATLAVYDKIHGHTHDSDPSQFESELDQRAAELGYTKHGSHWHGPDGSIITEDDLRDPDEPTTRAANHEVNAFPVGGRVKSSLEFGPDWSMDLGGSAVYQDAYRYSNRLDRTYSKGVFGADMTLFWHPLSMNKYRNLDLGAEWLMNFEENEELHDQRILESTTWRQGIFGHIYYRHSGRWHFGAYGELFEAQDRESWTKKRWGVFTTMEISHYQYLRLEGSTYHQSPKLNPVHRLTLQYDVTIGYHSHGIQR
jgi:hypothetical protein